MLCPLLSRHQVDPSTGGGEWVHQECLGAQCKFYNLPEAECQFLLTSRTGSVALPTAAEVTGAAAPLGKETAAALGKETAAQARKALDEGLDRLERLQSDAAKKLASAQADGLKRLEAAQTAAVKRLQSAWEETDERLERMQKGLLALEDLKRAVEQLAGETPRGEKPVDLARLAQDLKGFSQDVSRLGDRQTETLAALSRLEGRPGPEPEIQRLGGEVKALTQDLSSLSQELKGFGERSQKADQAREQVLDRLRTLETGQHEVLNTVKAQSEAVSSLPSRHEALSERLHAALEEALRAQSLAVGTRVSEELKTAGSEQARQFESLSEEVVRSHGRLLQALKKVEQSQDAGTTSLQALSVPLAGVKSAVERVPAEFQNLGKQVQELRQAASDAQEAARQRSEGIGNQVETVGRSIGQLAIIMKGMQGEVERGNHAVAGLRAENKGLVLALHEQKMAAQEEQKRRHAEQARELNNKGVALFHRGSLEAAVEAFIRACELKPDYAEAFNNLGLAYSRRGQSEEAVRYFQKALEIDPQMGEVYNNLGFLFHTGARYDRAIEMFTRSLQTGADQSIAYTNLGNSLYKMKQNDKAVTAWAKAIEIDPLNEAARRGLAMFQQEPAAPGSSRS